MDPDSGPDGGADPRDAASHQADPPEADRRDAEPPETEPSDPDSATSQTVSRPSLLIEHLPVGVYRTTPDGRLLEANQALVDLLGFPDKKSLMETDVREFYVDPEARQAWQERVAREGMATGIEVELERPDGEHVWVEMTVQRVGPDEQGRTLYEGTVLDITDRHQAEEALRESEALFRSLLSSAPDAMVIVDGAGKIRIVNAQVEALFGYQPEDLVGQPVEVLVPERFREGHVGHREEYMEAPRTRPMGASLDLYGLRKDGTEFPVEISLAPVDTPGGPRVLAAVRDVTEQRQAQRALRERTHELEAANQELAHFARAISHDLNAPLVTIDGFAHRLLTRHAEELDEEATFLLERIQASSSRLSELIGSLQALTRVTRREMTRRTVDLSELAAEVAEELASRHPDRDVQVTIEEGMEVRGDPALLRLALENLLGNAWKFTGEQDEPRVEVGVARSGRARVHYVRDNGVGFDPDRSDGLFQPFRRLHSEEEWEGTGIGLATVRRIVSRHGGRIWAEAAPGKGATFLFTLDEPRPHGGDAAAGLP